MGDRDRDLGIGSNRLHQGLASKVEGSGSERARWRERRESDRAKKEQSASSRQTRVASRQSPVSSLQAEVSGVSSFQRENRRRLKRDSKTQGPGRGH